MANNNNEEDDNQRFSSGAMLFGWICGSILTALFEYHRQNYISTQIHIPNSLKSAQVQKGHLEFDKLELESPDMDGNGKLESLMRYRGKPYILKIINGKPKLMEYEVQYEKYGQRKIVESEVQYDL